MATRRPLIAAAGVLKELPSGDALNADILALRNAGTGAFDLKLQANTTLTADRTLTFALGDADRTITLAGNLTLAGAFATSGANSLTLTTTGATNVTLPTSGTLATLTDLGSYQPLDAALTALAGGSDFVQFTGPATTTKVKTLRNADDTILELGGSYTPTGTWTSMTLASPSIAKLANLTSNGYVKTSGSDGTLSVDTTLGAANPTGTAGLTAVNGSAATFMRSDGAPALSQSIAPTWTGQHTFAPSSDEIYFNRATVGNRLITFQTGGSARWKFGVNNAAESGSDLGSNFVIYNYSDAGAFLGTALAINRNTGVINIGNGITGNGTVPTGGTTNQVLTKSSNSDYAFAWATLAGSGTVTVLSSGALTSNSLVLGAGTTVTKTVAGFTTDGTSVVTLGEAGTSAGGIDLKNATSGTISLRPVTGALGTVTVSVPAQTGTLLLNNVTAGVGASPTSSTTTTITHGLGRIPTIIRVYGGGTFTSNAAATPTVFSIGVYSSSGNCCMYQPFDPSTITATEPMATSTAYAVRCDTGVGNFVTGVIQNLTSTQFDIVWTETGTATAQVYMWEAQ